MTLRLKRYGFAQIVLGLFGLGVLLAGAGAVLLQVYTAPVKTGDAAPVVVEIPPESSTAQIAAILEEHELIRHQGVFRLYARVTGLDVRLQAGEYELSPNLSMAELLDTMVRGRTRLISFSVPEGLTNEQIIDLLAGQGLGDREAFSRVLDEIAGEHPFAYELPTGARSLEGYLFPDTYKISPGAGEEEIIRFMLARCGEVLEELDLTNRAEEHGLTRHEAVTLASLIEREARLAEERRIISGVLHNRMERGMLLQVDATVIYALGDFDRDVVLLADLEVDSPYNTYRYAGLPPGPIASPGRDSLLAAVEPAAHDYLYYVAKPDGSHAFSRTLAEHEANMRRYLP